VPNRKAQSYCSRRPVGDASRPPSHSYGAAGSEAATTATIGQAFIRVARAPSATALSDGGARLS